MSIAARMPFGMHEGPILQAARRAVASNHISRIVAGSAKEQVVRIDTVANVARMANDLAFGAHATEVLESEAMHQGRIAVDLHHSIAKSTRMASPEPAGVGLLDVAPEALVQILLLPAPRCARAASRAVSADNAGPASVSRSALEAR